MVLPIALNGKGKKRRWWDERAKAGSLEELTARHHPSNNHHSNNSKMQVDWDATLREIDDLILYNDTVGHLKPSNPEERKLWQNHWESVKEFNEWYNRKSIEQRVENTSRNVFGRIIGEAYDATTKGLGYIGNALGKAVSIFPPKVRYTGAMGSLAGLLLLSAGCSDRATPPRTSTQTPKQTPEQLSPTLKNIVTATSKPKLAPSGVGSMSVYEERIGESGLLFEGPNLQMWVPQRYSEHAQVVFEYLQKGYPIISELLGGYKLPYKLSVEHYPRGSQYWSGGTRGIGTIEYDYTNLEGNSPEWMKYQVPHVVGYYEEMAHNFIWQMGAPGFYETIGMMTGIETALRAAGNPHVQAHADWAYQASADTHSYYLEHNVGQPDLPPNIWLTRVLVHIFKSEVVDTYGWQAVSQAFADMQRKGLPLQKYNNAHKNGAFLDILSDVTATDMHAVFYANGMPLLTWTGENGYEKDGVERITGNRSSFRVRIFDREGTQPANVRLFLYEKGSTQSQQYPMSLVEGNAKAGWIYEKTVDIARPRQYAFGAEDGLYAVFQAVGKPTVKRIVE